MLHAAQPADGSDDVCSLIIHSVLLIVMESSSPRVQQLTATTPLVAWAANVTLLFLARTLHRTYIDQSSGDRSSDTCPAIVTRDTRFPLKGMVYELETEEQVEEVQHRFCLVSTYVPSKRMSR